MSKTDYVIQPYQVGGKQAKSLAMIFPARIAREHFINVNTIFILKVQSHDQFVLERIPNAESFTLHNKKKNMQAKNLLVSREDHH